MSNIYQLDYKIFEQTKTKVTIAKKVDAVAWISKFMWSRRELIFYLCN